MSADKLRISDLQPFENTVAGHDGVMADATGDLIIKPCTATEVAFYEACANHPIFNAVVPTFMGTLSLSSETEKGALDNAEDLSLVASALQASNTTDPDVSTSRGKKLDTQQAIVLENIAAGFQKPNILDVKLGIRLWADDASPEKRNNLDIVSSETTSGSLGFRVAGMRIWQPGAGNGAGEYRVYGKSYGRKFTAQTVTQAFEEFFFSETGEGTEKKTRLSQERKEVIRRLSNEVGSIQDVLENEESRMYSASILFVYEGDMEVLKTLLTAELEQQALSERNEEHQSIRMDDVSDNKEDNIGDGDDEEELDDCNEEEEEDEARICAASLIDFAHASFTPGEGPDENALRGVRNVRALLDSFLLP